MKAVILAAGQGTRMGSLTQNKPKVMLPVGNKPILEHIINSAYDAGIRDFVFVVGYHEEIIKEYFGDGKNFGVNIQYVTQTKQQGTADAVRVAEKFVNERFIVLNGDILVSSEHIKHLLLQKFDFVMTAREVNNPSNYGVIEVDGNRVLKIVEKPKIPLSNLGNAGLYIFSPDIFDFIRNTTLSVRGEYEITDSLQMLIDKGFDIGYVTLSGKWLDIGHPWDLLDANEFFLSSGEYMMKKNTKPTNNYKLVIKLIEPEIKGNIEPFTTLKGNVNVGEGTIIRNGSYIVGPVIIGKNCDIGPNCYIRPFTSIGDNVKIGNAVEVKNSIIMKNTNIGHLSYVGDSIIGERCNFGAGTKVANLRHDGRNVLVKLKGVRVDSGKRKLGTIMGDDVHTGINSMINVGRIVENGTMIMPGEFLK